MITSVIEKFLLTIDQASFQKLMTHLLYLEGYKFISSPGSVIGKNKTSKGTPDIFFADGESFIFCELTTKEKIKNNQTFLSKLRDDIDHCFNENITGIKKSRIKKIILGFTDELTPSEYSELKSKVHEYNRFTELAIYSIQEIPFRLIYYPGLADKYIPGIKTTKGAIHTLPDFLDMSEKGIQPPLSNPFFGRAKEIDQAKRSLTETDVLIIQGKQGIGKSKFVLELSQIFEKEFGYEVRIIVGSPTPLWDDLSTFIHPGRKYFIMLDDANKSLPNLDYLLQFITQKEIGSIKVVLTVRDYARHDLNKYLQNTNYNELTLDSLESKEITEILNSKIPEGNMLDPVVSERILSLAKGNCRLALMALSYYMGNNGKAIPENAISLYEHYFERIRLEILFLDNHKILAALGVISFFGVLEKDNQEVKQILENSFGLNWNELWENILLLDKSELVDVYDAKSVKISDQVLAAYAFLKCFIDKTTAVLNYSDWIVCFINEHEKKVKRTIIDIANTFGFKEVKEMVADSLINAQKKLEADNKNLYKFFDAFWFYRQYDTLAFVNNWIKGLPEQKIPFEDIKFSYEVNDHIWPPKYLSLMLYFLDQHTDFTRQAIKMLLELIFKQPSRTPETLKHLCEHLNYHRFDYRHNYVRQFALFEALENFGNSEIETNICDRLFLASMPSFLEWEYHQVSGAEDGKMNVYNFKLVKTPFIIELRKKIITKLFRLFEKDQNAVLSALIKSTHVPVAVDICAEEYPLIKDFIKEKLDPEIFSHCKFVEKYNKSIAKLSLPASKEFEPFVNSDLLKISRIFRYSSDDQKSAIAKAEQIQKKKIKNYVSGKDIEFIKRLFLNLSSIYRYDLSKQDSCWIDSGIPDLFLALAEENIRLYYQSIELIILGDYPFNLKYGNMIADPVSNRLADPNEMYDVLNRHHYAYREFWNKMFFEALPEESVTEYFFSELIKFINSLKEEFHFYSPEKYLKYQKQFVFQKSMLGQQVGNHDNIISYITDILLSKNDNFNLSFSHSICEDNLCYFESHPDLLKKVYTIQKNKQPHYDYNGKEIAALCSLAPSFLLEYFSDFPDDEHVAYSDLDDLHLSFVWKMPEYENLIDKCLDIIVSKAPLFSSIEHPANMLFREIDINEVEKEKVYKYISRFIANKFSSKEHIWIIMNVIIYQFDDQMLRFLKEFLLLNKNVEFMHNLWLEKNTVLVNSSRVPGIDAHIQTLESVITMIYTLPGEFEYSDHIKYFEREIEFEKQNRDKELKRDFRGWVD